MIKLLKYIVMLLSLMGCALLFQACPMDYVSEIRLENNTKDTLIVHLALGYYTAYPDTLLPEKYEYGMLHFGGCNETKTILYKTESFEKIYRRLPKDTLSIFILEINHKKDSLWWDEMNYGKLFLWRYDLSLEDIRRLKSTIIYPPDERMRGIKMYPPYSSIIDTTQ